MVKSFASFCQKFCHPRRIIGRTNQLDDAVARWQKRNLNFLFWHRLPLGKRKAKTSLIRCQCFFHVANDNGKAELDFLKRKLTMTDKEAAGLRAYVKKGGFLIIDDFKPTGWRGMRSGGWEPFVNNMKKVLPAARIFDLQPNDTVFHSFFEINDLQHFPQAYNAGAPVFRGIFEDNDRRKRLMVMINYNTDVSQFWEWSGRGVRPFEQTNEAYKLGVNYLIYGLTH